MKDDDLEAVIAYVRDHRGFDFTGYKRPSLGRRVQRRLDDLGIGSVSAYLAVLRERPEEFTALFNTILINVTSFFRDGDPWEVLGDRVLPEVLATKAPDAPVRVWVPGCASGEEAYTVAMLLCEVMGEEAFRDRVKIYGTDVDQDALTLARRGRYRPDLVAEQVGPDRATRFFETDGGLARFRRDLRRAVIFGRHDLVQDPPIVRLDLVTCRNTLMYLTAQAQASVLANLHFALRPSGYLMLGRSEAISAGGASFTAVHGKARIFRAVPDGEPARPPRSSRRTTMTETPGDHEIGPDLRTLGFEVSAVAQVLIDRVGRLAAVNHQARVLFGLTRADLGRPLQDLELSYRPLELRSRVGSVRNERRTVIDRRVSWERNGTAHWFDVAVMPVTGETGSTDAVSVTFADVTALRHAQDELERSRSELENAHEELQSMVEELETTNEELQSMNEELETTNEELQSMNEELETMNEELHSTNEELETANDELLQRSADLNEVNAFLEAILSGLTSAVVVVDRDVQVQVWNAHAGDVWGLRSDEAVGEHLMNLDIGLPVEQLLQPIRTCLAGGVSEELTLPAVNRRGRSFSCRVVVSPLATQPGAGATGAILVLDGADATSGPELGEPGRSGAGA